MIKRAYSVSFLLSINIFVWQNVLYFLDAPRIMKYVYSNRNYVAETRSLTHSELFLITVEVCISICVHI